MYVSIQDDIETINDNIEKGDQMLRSIEILEGQQSKLSGTKEMKDLLFQEITNLEKQIEELREERVLIIENSNLPEGLSIDDGNIVFNGFPFDETVSSYTEAQIVLIELMIKISNSELINIGDWSVYDSENKAKILKMAQEGNRLIVGQLVTDSDEVEMEVQINN